MFTPTINDQVPVGKKEILESSHVSVRVQVVFAKWLVGDEPFFFPAVVIY
jgi:hypothetical protein